MKKLLKFLTALLAGVLCARLAAFGAELLLRGLGNLIGAFGASLGLRASEAAEYAAILGQLRSAAIETPVLPMLIACCASMLLTSRIVYSRRAKRTPLRILTAAVIWLLLLLPLTFACLWFTHVNGLRFGTVIRVLLPIVQSGAL